MKLLIAFIALIATVPTFAATGTFKMYREPHARINPNCDVYTELKLDVRGNTAYATLTNELAGSCEIYVKPNKRTYELDLSSKDCGSYEYTWDDGADYEISLTDNRGRLCKNAIPALIVIRELNKNDATERVLYSNDR